MTSLGNNLAYGLNNLASYLIDNGRPVEALRRLAEARPIVGKLLAVDPGSLLYRRKLARNCSLTGKALARMGRRPEARESFEEAVSIWRKLADGASFERLLPAYPGRFFPRSRVDVLEGGLAGRGGPGLHPGAEIRQRIVAAEPSSRSDRDALANCETNVAAALLALGRLSESRACCERALALREELFKVEPGNESYARGLADTLLRSGGAKAAAGDTAGAAADWRRAAGLHAAHPPAGGEPAISRACCHGALAGLAGMPGSGVSAAEAAVQAGTAIAILRRLDAGGYRDPDFLMVEPGLAPLRSRDDFRLLMMDVQFPAEPFEGGLP